MFKLNALTFLFTAALYWRTSDTTIQWASSTDTIVMTTNWSKVDELLANGTFLSNVTSKVASFVTNPAEAKPHSDYKLEEHFCQIDQVALDNAAYFKISNDYFAAINRSDVVGGRLVPVPPRTKVMVRCHVGYELADGRAIAYTSCIRDNVWQSDGGKLPTCNIKSCPPVLVVDNTTQSTTEHTFNTTVIYRCVEGTFYGDGTTNRTITCLESKIWNARVNPCGDKIEPKIVQIPKAEAQGAKTVGMIMVGLLFGFIVFLILLDLATISSSLRVGRRNLSDLVVTIKEAWERKNRSTPVAFKDTELLVNDDPDEIEGERDTQSKSSKKNVRFADNTITKSVSLLEPSAIFKPELDEQIEYRKSNSELVREHRARVITSILTAYDRSRRNYNSNEEQD